MTDRQFIHGGRRSGKAALQIQQMIDAYARARLTVPFEVAIADPALATCLENIVHSNQANTERMVDLRTVGSSLVMTPVASPKPDRMRLAAGDQDD